MIAALAFPHPPRDPDLAGPRDQPVDHSVRRHRALRQHPGLVWLQTATTGDYVPALHVRCSGGKRAVRFTLLYAHGNAEDLGQIAGWLDEVARVCDVDVFAYEVCVAYASALRTRITAPITPVRGRM